MQLSKRMTTALVALAALGVGALGFVVGLHLTFPDDLALQRLRYEVQSQSKGTMALQAADLDLWGLSGGSLDQVALISVQRPRGRLDPNAVNVPKGRPVLQADRLSARLQLLPALRQAWMVSYDARLYGGRVEGEAGLDGDLQRLVAEAEDIDLSLVPLVGDGWSLDLAGLLALDADVVLNTDDIKASEGKASLTIEGLKLAGGEVAGLTLDEIPFSEAVLAFEIEDGLAKVTEGHFVSEMLQATVTGDITLNKEPRRCRLRLSFEITLSDKLDSLARFAPGMKSARDENGVYHFMLAGTPGLARFREDRMAARGNVRGRPSLGDEGPGLGMGPGMGGALDGAGPDEEGGEDDAETRRQRRLDRIRRARERRDAGDNSPSRRPDPPSADPPTSIRKSPEDFEPRDRWEDEGPPDDREDDPMQDEGPDQGPFDPAEDPFIEE